MKTFMPISIFLAFLPAALGVPTLNSRQDTKAVEIEVEVARDTSGVTITVTDQESSKVLGHSCSSNLDSGDFAKFPITTNLDDYGGGKITIGPTVYEVHEDPKVSGGITCSRIYNNEGAFVTCTASIPASIQATALSERGLTGCSARSLATDAISSLKSASKSIHNAAPMPETEVSLLNETVPEVDHSLNARQYQCATWTRSTVKVGNGNPHQRYLHKQLSENMKCESSSSCTVAHEVSKSFSIGWSATVNPFQWISGGFNVAKTWTTGNQYTCYGAKGDTVCIWYNTAHTAYKVRNVQNNVCGGSPIRGKEFYMVSPNKRNVGGNYYCVIGTCRNQGDGYWVRNGRAGGP